MNIKIEIEYETIHSLWIVHNIIYEELNFTRSEQKSDVSRDQRC